MSLPELSAGSGVLSERFLLESAESVQPGRKRVHQEADSDGAAKKKVPETKYPCPAACGSSNHIKSSKCGGCGFNLRDHAMAKKKADEESKPGKLPKFCTVLNAFQREGEKLGQHGCSVSLQIHDPSSRWKGCEWLFGGYGTGGGPFSDNLKVQDKFKETVEREKKGEREGKEHKGSKRTKVSEKVKHGGNEGGCSREEEDDEFVLPPELEEMLKGLGPFGESKKLKWISRFKEACIDIESAKSLDDAQLKELFGQNMIGPIGRFKAAVKALM